MGRGLGGYLNCMIGDTDVDAARMDRRDVLCLRSM